MGLGVGEPSHEGRQVGICLKKKVMERKVSRILLVFAEGGILKKMEGICCILWPRLIPTPQMAG